MTEVVLSKADTKQQRFSFLLRLWMASENITGRDVTRRLTEAGFQTNHNSVTRWINGSYKRLPSGLTHFLGIVSGFPKEYWEVDREGDPVAIGSDGLKIRFTLK